MNLFWNEIVETKSTFRPTPTRLDQILAGETRSFLQYLGQVTGQQCVIKTHKIGSNRCVRFDNFAPKEVYFLLSNLVCVAPIYCDLLG